MGQYDVDVGAFAKEGQDRAAAQSQALMGIIAQHGQAGAEAYAQGQQAIAQQGSTAMSAAAGNARGSAVADSGQFAGENNQRMQAIQSLYQQDMAAGNASFGRDMDRARSSNSDYMGQLSASLPIVAQNVQSQAQALGARAAAEQARREQERQMAEMQMQMQREQLQAAREDREAKKNGEDDPLLGAKLRAADDAHNASQYALEHPDQPKADPQAREDTKARALRDALAALGGPNTRGAQALGLIMAGKDASSVKTPGGRPLDMDLINRLAQQVMFAGV